MRSAPRAVLDTNVVLSALLFSQGRLARLRPAWQQASFHPLVSKATTEELMRVLAYPKFKLAGDEQRELLADYLPYCTPVAMPVRLPRTPPCRDPLDLPFLQLAVVGNADCLVTGDRNLLGLQGEMKCPIVTGAEFLLSLDRLPIESYGDQRIAEFDAAEAELGAVLKRRRTAKGAAARTARGRPVRRRSPPA